jgi:hypothetical protein
LAQAEIWKSSRLALRLQPELEQAAPKFRQQRGGRGVRHLPQSRSHRRRQRGVIQFCRETGLVSGRLVALDGTKMRAVANPKNFAGADRLARDVAHTEK